MMILPIRTGAASRAALHSVLIMTAIFPMACGTELQGQGEGDDVSEPEVTELQASLTAASAPCAAGVLVPVGAAALSVENASLGASLAIDGNANTRWSSAFSDPQWLRIDLGAPRFIGRVRISFETAASRAYTIQVSNDATAWTTLFTQSNGPAGPNVSDITGLDAKARYVRLFSTARTTPYGVSIFEITIFGDSDATCSPMFRIDSVHSGKTLDVTGISTAPGAFIQQWTFGGGNNQKWIVNPLGAGLYQIVSVHSGLCLDVSGASLANGARLQQSTCQTVNNQRFRLNSVGNARYQIVASHSGKCLDVRDFSTANGGVIQQWSCSTNNNQRWTLTQLAVDINSDPNNCGALGHSCFGGRCVSRLCEAGTIITDSVCASNLAVDAQNVYVADDGNIFRYTLAGGGKATVHTRLGTANPIQSLIRDGSQLFFSNNSGVQRRNDGQSTVATLYPPSTHRLNLTSPTLVGLDFTNSRFVSFDRNLASPGAFSVVTNLTEAAPSSAATSAHLYYVTGNSAGSTLFRVARAGGAVTMVDSAKGLGPMTAFGDTVYWNYFDQATGDSGIRRLSSAAGAMVEEAVPPAGGNDFTTLALVDQSGIYHSFSTTTSEGLYRTSHTDPTARVLISRSAPVNSLNVGSTADSIYWLDPCFFSFPGTVSRLAKP